MRSARDLISRVLRESPLLTRILTRHARNTMLNKRCGPFFFALWTRGSGRIVTNDLLVRQSGSPAASFRCGTAEFRAHKGEPAADAKLLSKFRIAGNFSGFAADSESESIDTRGQPRGAPGSRWNGSRVPSGRRPTA